ncbi:beta strand repeat-containing protein [Spirosoma agri]
MYNYRSNPSLTNCVFSANSASTGGGIYNDESSPSLTNCVLSANSAGGDGGGMFNGNSSPSLTNCVIQNNSANQGAGIANASSSLGLLNCLLSGNTARGDGGALYSISGLISGSTPTLTNCTLTANRAASGAALRNNYTGTQARLTNCILWDNQEATSTSITNDSGGSTTANYSLIGAGESDYTSSGPTNLTATSSPFASSTDFSLNACSIAINAGDPNSNATTNGTTDLAGNPRFYQNGRIDIGAYEYQGSLTQPLAITSQPPSASNVTTGSNISAPASVTGSVTSYQWYKDNLSSPVTGQTSATLNLTNVQTGATGSYSVVVTGACNSVTSTAFSLSVSAPSQPIRYVKQGGTGDGSSWTTASGDLQAMINALGVQQVWVAQGTYKPGPPNNTDQSISFAMKDGVAIYGGFVGTEANLSDRRLGSPSSTTLSGDIGTVGNNADNSYHVIFKRRNDPALTNTAVLDGFVITGGNSDGDGGGIYLAGNDGNNPNNPRLVNLSFVANSASSLGGGLFNNSARPILVNCLFLGNSANSGGGIYDDFSFSSVTNCSFANNSAPGGGGAIATFYGSPSLTNCVLFGNGGINTFARGGLGAPSVSYSLLEPEVTSYFSDQGNNRTTSTLPFVSATDLRLNPCSPAINAGNPNSTTATSGSTDLADQPRFYPAGGIIDMGAYEFQGNPAQLLAITSQPPSGSSVTAGSTVSVPVSVSGSVSGYQWYKDNLSNAVAGQTSATLTLTNVQPSNAGSYSLVVSGTCNSVTSTAFRLSVSDPTPTIADVAATPSPVCAGSPVTFTATIGNVTGNYAYTLTNGSSTSTGTKGESTFSQTLTASGSGQQTFTLTVQSSGGQRATATATLTVNPLPTATLTASPSMVLSCAQTSLTLTAGDGTSYLFSGPGLVGQSGNQAVVNTPGTYSVSVTSAGCSSTTSIAISQDNSQPTVSITPSTATLSCAVPTATLTANTSASSLTWSTGQTTASITVSVAGTYSVSVTSANGCMAMAQATVSGTTDAPVAPTLSASPATSTTNQPITVTASGCSGGTINWTALGGTGQASGNTYTLAQPGNYTLSASCNLNGCTSSSSTPLSVQIRPGGFAITGVSMVNCQLIDEAKGGYQVQFTPQYAGQTNSPISFSVVNELAATTKPAPYSLRLYTDNPVITLVATQAGNGEARFAYNWLASCQSGTSPNQPPTTTGIPSQTILVGQGYQLQLTTYFSDPDGQALTFQASGLPTGLSLSGSVISGTPSQTGVSTVTVTALDPGVLQVSTSFQLTVTPMPVTPPTGFAIVGVSTVSCQVLSAGERRLTFTPQYAGQNASPISFSVVNEKLPTTDPGPYSLNLYTDNPSITLSAQQGATVSTYRYNWLAVCNPAARIGIGEASTRLQVRALGNPVDGKMAEIEISGAMGQPVQLNLVDMQGKSVHTHRIDQAGGVERVSLPLGASTGVLLLRVSTPTQSQQIKLLAF